jgi:hypothetical protein
MDNDATKAVGMMRAQGVWFAAYVVLYMVCVAGSYIGLAVVMLVVGACVVAQKPKSFVVLWLLAVPLTEAIINGNMLRFVAVGLFVIVPAWLLGEGIARQRPAHWTIGHVSAVLVLIQACWWGTFGGVGQLRSMVYDGVARISLMYDPNIVHKYAEVFMNMSRTKLPALMVFVAIGVVVFVYGCLRTVSSWLTVSVPRLLPVVDWRLSRAFVWVFVAVVVLDMFVSDPPVALWEWVVVNVLLLGLGGFAVIGFSFLAFVGDVWRINVLPWIVLIGFVSHPTPLAIVVMSMLGVIDTTFAVRQMITPAQKK